MRTEEEMFQLILGIAKRDERVRAVYMNGSRANPTVSKDIFQDYDIVYVVTNVDTFVNDKNWITQFGELLMVQEPEKMDDALGRVVNLSQNYGYLMLFTDGNRIDLHLQTKEFMLTNYRNDSLTIPLLDKDGCLPTISQATDKDYWTKRPSEAEYFSCCNDFWWCLQNVAKGIWRDELPYAKQMFELVIRPRLDQIVSWWIGMGYDFKISSGKMGKYFRRYLPSDYWEKYQNTYSDSNYEKNWEALFTTCELFRTLAKEVANELSFDYQYKDDINMTRYLKSVRNLPICAQQIF
ncbi:aminoglycoside 6-adenylyltransferase [Ornithinibacillus californiensis]|uniref:aminoglycoside 6-adenylyltransferase n=1 Tax=Ornithinibacillus californiensis TaxID=161536 RepID=UPI00064DD6D5|nr:aminoglycoside 6-adenylyltransferase [Ornithinibacillus californiensis]